ncbi:D-dopachrome decarboxylase [Sarotherodon galilaeus]
MPFIELQSNLPAGQFSEAFLKRLCSSTAAALGKPEDRMNVVVTPGLPMLIAGSTSPCVILSVSAIGVTDTAEKNKEHSAKIFEFLTKELDLNQDSMSFILFSFFTPTGRSRWPPLPEPGSAGGFFLLKGSFSFPLSPKCLLIGGHMI